ncbi:helix-hairpin-helix domain-containing protein [Clostridium algoriphilum]|uniref:helix-hairpin-helix domain-containing protein n=1 Tax=Clostridium algoriphilum TaxID=198347 RepID=UPI001CF0E48C|nr:helix-hairpin-helix domain-containing protein [Clostridium algoriphilum]MCB2292541.1 helix-hairpin-helix domain-containing protein [Clostridium algoriphilum]
MKNKEKIIGSLVILFISITFIVAGYIMSSPKENVNATDYKDIFVEADKTTKTKDNGGAIATGSNKEESTTKVASGSAKVADNSIKVEDSNIKVDIKGAVKDPGVYEIEKGSRVTDLIKLAGGGTKDADLDATNLSSKLNDEDCIIISKKGEAAKQQPLQSTISQSNVPKSTTNNSAVSSSSGKEIDTIIDINTASKEELKTLTGIGDAKADVIIEYREQNGGFKSVEELTKVGGIGEKTLSKFVDKIDIK